MSILPIFIMALCALCAALFASIVKPKTRAELGFFVHVDGGLCHLSKILDNAIALNAWIGVRKVLPSRKVGGALGGSLSIN